MTPASGYSIINWMKIRLNVEFIVGVLHCSSRSSDIHSFSHSYSFIVIYIRLLEDVIIFLQSVADKILKITVKVG